MSGAHLATSRATPPKAGESRGRVFVGVVLGVAGFLMTPPASASIDTAFIEAPWPRQWVHDYEVGTWMVRWRQKASRREGIFAGAGFMAPTDLQQTWALSTDYSDLGPMTPGVNSVTILEETENRRVIAIDIKVLWKDLHFVFEVEQEPPKAVRFRMVHEIIGDYRGVCWLEPDEDGGTHVELATWLKPAVNVPSRLVLWVERSVMLKGIRSFLETCKIQHAREVGVDKAG